MQHTGAVDRVALGASYALQFSRYKWCKPITGLESSDRIDCIRTRDPSQCSKLLTRRPVTDPLQPRLSLADASSFAQ
jgi:hypothetical protein